MLGDETFWTTVAKFAPIATATIACLAAAIAFVAVLVQRDIARRRAAIDFFLKTEMDKEMVLLYERFKLINVATLRTGPNQKQTDQYKDARAFLNICELIAVGISMKAFSDKVSRAYWGDVLPDAFSKMRPLILDIRAEPGFGTRHTYADLEKVTQRWLKLDRRQQ